MLEALILTRMDKPLARYVRFNGYLIFGCTLLIVFYETVSLVNHTLYYEQNLQLLEGYTVIRRHLVGRWIAAVVWLIALAAYFMAMQWKDGEFFKPAKFLFLIDFLMVGVEDLTRTIKGDDDERFIQDEKCLLVFCVIVIYILYTINTLQRLFQSQRLETKSRESKINLLNGGSSDYSVSVLCKT